VQITRPPNPRPAPRRHREPRRHLRRLRHRSGNLTIYTEKLAAALNALAPNQFDFRPVEMVGRSRTKYLEPLPKRIASLPRPIAMRCDESLGWKCPACGFTNLYHDWQTFAATSFYRRSEIPSRDCFTLINSFGSIDICVTADWWKSHRRKPYTRAVVAREIGILDDAQIDPTPRLRPHSRGQREDRPWRELWHDKQHHFAHHAPKFAGWTL
jgi:hypothetical protein